MKGLFQHDQTSRIKSSGPEMSKEKSKTEVIEYLKDKESFGNSLVGEELRHEEQTTFLTESPVTGYHGKCFLHGGKQATNIFLIETVIMSCY